MASFHGQGCRVSPGAATACQPPIYLPTYPLCYLPARPATGYTPLHMAAGYMHTTTIAALLQGGADPEQQDRQGRRWAERGRGVGRWRGDEVWTR